MLNIHHAELIVDHSSATISYTVVILMVDAEIISGYNMIPALTIINQY